MKKLNYNIKRTSRCQGSKTKLVAHEMLKNMWPIYDDMHILDVPTNFQKCLTLNHSFIKSDHIQNLLQCKIWLLYSMNRYNEVIEIDN